MLWIALTVAAVVSRAGYGVLSKVMTNTLEFSSPTNSALLLWMCTPIAFALSPFLGGLSTQGISESWISVVAMILTISFGGITYFKGVSLLGAGVAQIAFSSIVVWGVALSVAVLGSTFTWIQLLGALVLMAAIWIAQYDGSKSFNLSVVYILVSAACFAGFQVTSADLSGALTGGTYLVLAYLGPAIVTTLACIGYLRNDASKIRTSLSKAVLTIVPAACGSTAYYAFAFFAYRHAPDPGVVVVLLTTQTIVAVLLAMAFLNERHHMRRTLLAALLGVAAAAMIQL